MRNTPSEIYAEKLHTSPGRGYRHEALFDLAYWAIRAGRTEDQFTEDATVSWNYAQGDHTELREVYRAKVGQGILPASRGNDRAVFAAARPEKPWEPPECSGLRLPPLDTEKAASFVSRIIEQHRDTPEKGMDALRAISPEAIPTDRREQTSFWFQRVLFPLGWYRISERNATDVKTGDQWMDDLNAGKALGPLAFPNAFTGGTGRNSAGMPSRCSADCLAEYKYAVIEFDNLPLADQCAFMCGAIADGLLPSVVSVCFSGGKSLHAVIDLGQWGASRDLRAYYYRLRLKPLFCSSVDARYCADPAGLRLATQGTRLPGAIRENGKAQELLYLLKPEYPEIPQETP